MEPTGETGRTARRQIAEATVTKTTERKKTGLNGHKNCTRHSEVLCYVLIRYLMPFLSFSLVIL